MIRAEKNRAGTARDPWLPREIALCVRVLQDHPAAVEEQIATLVKTRDRLAAGARRLRSVPGIRPAAAAVLPAGLPELGQPEARQIAALAGLAPHACDCGLSRSKRLVGGGRAGVLRELYLAAVMASRYDPVLMAFRKRLQDAGRPTKVAVTACARKLLTNLGAPMRDGRDHVKQAA